MSWKKKLKAVLSLGAVWSAGAVLLGSVVSVFSGLYMGLAGDELLRWILGGVQQWGVVGFLAGAGFGSTIAAMSRRRPGAFGVRETLVAAGTVFGVFMAVVMVLDGPIGFIEALISAPQTQLAVAVILTIFLALAFFTKRAYDEEEEGADSDRLVRVLEDPRRTVGIDVEGQRRAETTHRAAEL